MDEVVFCLAQNMAFYFHEPDNQELIRNIFLSMDIIGFHYKGIQGDSYEILNGINGTSSDFLKRCLQVFGFRQELFTASITDNGVWERRCMLIADDYYLPFHPFYQKHHNERFITTVSRQGDECTIYDMGEMKISLTDLSAAVKGFFHINGYENHVSQHKIAEALGGYFTRKEWAEEFGHLQAIRKFRDDFADGRGNLDSDLLDQLYFFINKLGGPTETRRSTGVALEGLARELGITAGPLYDKMQIFKELTDEWDITGSLFFKVARLPREKVFERIVTRLDRIIELEASV